MQGLDADRDASDAEEVDVTLREWFGRVLWEWLSRQEDERLVLLGELAVTASELFRPASRPRRCGGRRRFGPESTKIDRRAKPTQQCA